MTVATNVLTAAVWFLCSAALSVFNSALVSSGRGHFPAPLLMTSIQFAYQWALATLVLKLTACAPQRPMRTLTWDEWARSVAPAGLCTGADIGMSNLSLVLITVSFYTMCKSSSPVFLLLFAFSARVERPSWQLAGIILLICVGVVLTVAGETQFNAMGFTLVMGASALSGLRWVLMQQMVSKKELGITTPLASLSALMPVMAGTVLCASILFEHPWAAFEGSWYARSWRNALETLCLIGIGALLAFVMTSAEFKLVCDTSAVTVTVAGVCKEVFTIVVSMGVYGDELTPLNFLGLVVVVGGVGLYSRWKLERYKHGELSTSADSEPQRTTADVFVLEDDDVDDVEAASLLPGRPREEGSHTHAL